MLLGTAWFSPADNAENPGAVKWDYIRCPVKVSEYPGSPNWVIGIFAPSAFDGYGASGKKPACVRAWHVAGLPTETAPFKCEIDYGTPIAVSAFVHYFYVPWSRDLRFLSPAPSAFKRVKISYREGDANWVEAAMLDNLPIECPQILPVTKPKLAQHWRIEVLEMAKGSEMLLSYEIETYTGGIPKIEAREYDEHDFCAKFAERMRKHEPVGGPITGKINIKEDGETFLLSVTANGKPAPADILFMGAAEQHLRFEPNGANNWKYSCPEGEIIIKSGDAKTGVLIELSFSAKPDNPIKYMRTSVNMTAPDISLYYMPAYVWSTTPVDSMVNACNVQTRFAAISSSGRTLCLVPGTDRGNLGFAGGMTKSLLLIGPEPTSVLLTAIDGDWWKAYQFGVTDIFNFKEQSQTVPVSEIQYGISRYLLSDQVWEPALDTLKSWPEKDFHTSLYGFDAFSFYGAPYSIPTYWARYVMNGDALALERCRSIAHWMCASGLRVKEGPAKGAFYTLQRFPPGSKPDINARGCTQGWGIDTLTSQATGAALWSLLYYRKVTGDKNQEINTAINEASDWLLKTQLPDGGWPFSHELTGKPVDAPPSSGTIWNIWALYRLGKETGDAKYLDAANRAKNWYVEQFVKPHHYHGYWEDVGPGSREGYDAAIAAVAFGDMGEKELVIETAKDAIQWIFTRQIEPREPDNSAGLVAEQTGWPPAAYCNPMMGLAAWTAWQASGDDFWRPFAMIPKAIGWWYQPDSGAMVWIVDSAQMAPLVGPAFESWWNDWCIAQTGSLTLRWLVREVNRRSENNILLNEETLSGTALNRSVKAWAPTGGLHPILPKHGQVNWLGMQSDSSILIAFMNYGDEGEINCHLDSRDAKGTLLKPKTIHRLKDKTVNSMKWDGASAAGIDRDGIVILEWELQK